MKQIVRLKSFAIALFAVAFSSLLGVSSSAAQEPEHQYDGRELGCNQTMSHSWKFGIMSDTQWKSTDTGNNPNTVAVGIVNQLNRQFISQDVDFVIQVGDHTVLILRRVFSVQLLNRNSRLRVISCLQTFTVSDTLA